MSILRYGGYTHAAGECRVSILPSLSFGDGGPPRIRTQWVIEVDMVAPSSLSGAAATAYLTARFLQMQAAYTKLGYNLIYECPAGTLAQQILWNTTLDGIKFDLPSVNPKDGEWATNLIVTIRANAEIPLAPPNGIVSWQEDVTLIGDGGPDVVWSAPIRGKPRAIQLRECTTYKVAHSVNAVGLTAYPRIAPYFRSRPPLIGEPVIRQGSATNINGVFRNFPVSGQWQYESDTPLILAPRSFA